MIIPLYQAFVRNSRGRQIAVASLIAVLCLFAIISLVPNRLCRPVELLMGSCWSPEHLVVASAARRPLNIVIATRDEVRETRFWAFELIAKAAALSARPVNIIVQDPNDEQVIPDSVVLVFFTMDKYAKMSDEWRDANEGEMLNLGIFRVGDEQMEDTASTYSSFDYVLRTYANHHESISYWTQPTRWDQNVMKVAWAPNGWAADVGPREPQTLTPTSIRPTMCLFAGGRHSAPHWISNRKHMFDVLDHMDHKCVFPPGNIPWRYATVLSQTKYGLAPGGNVPETIRFYESLENGAVPIVVQEGWMEIAFGYLPLDSLDRNLLPFPVLRNWTEFPALYQRLVSETAASQDARQVAVMDWWAEFKYGKRRDIANLIDSAFEAKYGLGA